MTLISRRLALAMSCAALTCLATPMAAHAEERGSKEEAKALVDSALEHIKKVGLDKACKDFTTDKATWNKKDLYVMAYDNKSVNLAHGGNEKLVGKDMSAVKDANGNAVVAGLYAAANKGGGWFDYDWPDPLTKKIMQKSTYAKKIPGTEGFVAVGVYR